MIKANTQDHAPKIMVIIEQSAERRWGEGDGGGRQGRRGKKYKESKVNFFLQRILS